MLQRPFNWRLLCFLPVLAMAPASALSSTNGPAPPLTRPEAIFDEANNFFTQYRQAARQLRDRREAEAVLTMNLLLNNLKRSPWMEIALLKQSELLESRNDQFATDNYNLLLQRLQNSPYFQGGDEKARLFSVALQGAVHNGINRIRARRLRVALDQYFVQHREYPESLAKLSVLGYTEMENVLTAGNNRPFRYVPTGQQFTPFLSYKRYEGLETLPPEPFLVPTPKLEGTSRTSDEPLKYAGIMLLPGHKEPVRVIEDQMIQDFIVLSVAPTGLILCNAQRILVLLTPD